jgi:DNA-binding cell septation regulator SpoVG
MAFNYDVEVHPFNSPGKTVAFVKLIIEGAISIDGFKIINGSNGLFVSAPQHKGKNKEGGDAWFDDVRFLGDKAEGQFRTPFQDESYRTMIEHYNKVTVGSASNSRGSAAAAQAQAQGSGRLWPQA